MNAKNAKNNIFPECKEYTKSKHCGEFKNLKEGEAYRECS